MSILGVKCFLKTVKKDETKYDGENECTYDARILLKKVRDQIQ